MRMIVDHDRLGNRSRVLIQTYMHGSLGRIIDLVRYTGSFAALHYMDQLSD